MDDGALVVGNIGQVVLLDKRFEPGGELVARFARLDAGVGLFDFLYGEVTRIRG